MKVFKILFLVVIPAWLLLCAFAAFGFASTKGLFQPIPAQNITYERYSLSKGQAWRERFDFQSLGEYNSVKRDVKGTRENFLEVGREGERYFIEYDAEIDVELISWVREVRQEGDGYAYKGRYFLVQYDRFTEIVFFEIDPQPESGVFQAQICLQLPIASSDNVRYHIDSHSNIWIVTASMNKVIFIQIYSCLQRRVVSEFRHILSDGQNVNQVARIKRRGECMGIEVMTYGLNLVELEVCPYSNGKSITEDTNFRSSHKVDYQEVVLKEGEYGVLQGQGKNIWKQQLTRITHYIYKFLMMGSTTSLLHDRPPSSDQHKKQRFDAITIDEQNHYLLDFSGNASSTGIKSLDRYMINAKHPLFHNNPAYHKLDVLKVLDREYRQERNPDIEHRSIVPGLNTTRRATYKAAFRTYPDVKVEHLGLTSKVLVFHPSSDLQQKDYSFVRTHEGGLVSEGIKFKGTFDKFPVQYQQNFQRVDAKAQQVVPGVFQAHVGYLNLMTYLIRSKDNQEFARIELMNMLGGRPVVTHYISSKEGFAYVSTMLLNSEWWILQYSRQQGRSMATKYQLYVNASSPEKVLSIKRVYGVIRSEQHLNGEDDLAELMSNFVEKEGKGYIFLNIYRCIDEYYYIEYSDPQGRTYGVARVHFKSLSNRRAKKSKKYSGFLERVLIVDEKDMIPERYSRKPYSVYVKNSNIFSHLPAMLDRNNPKDTWYKFCDNVEGGRTFRRLQKLGGFYYFPISHYAIGNYGCDFGSQRPHRQTFSAFNMRSMIIDGKQQIEDRTPVRKEIITWIFTGVGMYAVLAVFLCVFLGGKNENEGGKSQEKKDSAVKEKNN